ncbi:phage antirepressor N-terminal domain-containing protein [Psychrobacter sp. AT9]|uniref:phage antirepressor N-terminal domain-containing protein n=1 Tax=Psychrobacter sp. AT9 TaxID=3242893 RepID=UPI0039A77FE7
MTIIAKASTVGNNIKTIDFNGQTLLTIEIDGIHYTAIKPIAENIGLAWNAQFERIQRDDVLNSTVRVIRIVAEDGKKREMMCLPIDYLNGWLFGIDTKRVKPEVKAPLIQYKMQCYKVLHDYWHTGSAVHPSVNEDLPSSVKDRNGLIKTVHMTMKRLDLGFSEAFNLVLHRFNVAHVGDLTQSQVGEATEYLHRLMFAGSVDKFRQSDYEQVALSETDEADVVIEHGTPTTMVNQTMASGKFVGTIDHNGRMAMRELDAEEVIITVDMLPHLIDNRKININVLSRIVLSASHQLYTATYSQRPQQAVAIAQGGYHDSI